MPFLSRFFLGGWGTFYFFTQDLGCPPLSPRPPQGYLGALLCLFWVASCIGKSSFFSPRGLLPTH